MEDKTANNIKIFKKKKLRQLLVVIIVIPIVILMQSLDVMSLDPEIADIGPKVCLGIIFILLGFSVYNWRCPACNKYLGKSGIPKYCPKCGEQIA